MLPPRRPLDPMGAPNDTAAALAELVDAGATTANVSFVHHSLAHYLEQLESLASLR